MRKIQILKESKKLLINKKECCICSAIWNSLEHNGIYDCDLNKIFPLLTRENAKRFRNNKDRNRADYWWEPGDFKLFSGRRWFMIWLMWKYRNDKTEI